MRLFQEGARREVLKGLGRKLIRGEPAPGEGLEKPDKEEEAR
jgi:hypothetical protein